ncbi:MAG: SigE family RNA polymerase sigma factor [Actinomycetota bacterium]
MNNQAKTQMAEPGDTRETDIPVLRAIPDFHSFYRLEFEAVVGLAYALSGSRLAAEDLAQDAFVAAYRRWDEIGKYDKPGAWVRRAVANRSVSAIRRRVVEAKALPKLVRSEELPPELSAESTDVWRAVRRLPKRQAQVIALFYLEDLSLDDVASILDLSPETVRTHLRRARKTLARRLAILEDPNDS